MGLNVRLEKLTADEVRQLAAIEATSPEGRRIRARAGELLARRLIPVRRNNMPPSLTEMAVGCTGSGRWPLLVWFARQERIMTREELAAALDHL